MVEWFVVGASCWTLMWMLFVWLSYKKRKGVPLLLLHIYVILFWFRLFFYLRFPFVSQFVPFIFDHFSRFEPFIYSSTFLKVENDAICVLVHACMHFMNEWKQKKKIKGAFLCWFVEYCCCSNWASNYMSVLCDAQSADNMCEYVMRIERPCHGTTIVWELFTGGNVILVRLCLCVTFRYSSFCLCSFSISFNHFSMCWSFYIGSPK